MTREQYGQAFEKGGFRRTVEALRRRGAKPEDARETSQAAWAHGWEHLGQLRNPSRVVEWVITIAIRRLCDEALHSRRIAALPPDGYELASPPKVNPLTIDLARVLGNLPVRQRALIETVYLYEWSVAEAAAALGISAGAVHHRLSRARRALQKAMSPAGSQAIKDSNGARKLCTSAEAVRAEFGGQLRAVPNSVNAD